MAPQIDHKESKKSATKNTGSKNNAGSTNVSIDSDKTANMDDISKSIKKQLQDSEKRMDKKHERGSMDRHSRDRDTTSQDKTSREKMPPPNARRTSAEPQDDKGK